MEVLNGDPEPKAMGEAGQDHQGLLVRSGTWQANLHTGNQRITYLPPNTQTCRTQDGKNLAISNFSVVDLIRNTHKLKTLI